MISAATPQIRCWFTMRTSMKIPSARRHRQQPLKFRLSDVFAKNAAVLTAALLLAACGGESVDDGSSEEASGSLEPATQQGVERGDCSGTVEACSARDWCYVVNSLERLDAGGCWREGMGPVGCAERDIGVDDAVTGAVGPDGACWSFLNSGLPVGFSQDAECHRLIFQAPRCSD